jgi:hypothetical protein
LNRPELPRDDFSQEECGPSFDDPLFARAAQWEDASLPADGHPHSRSVKQGCRVFLNIREGDRHPVKSDEPAYFGTAPLPDLLSEEPNPHSDGLTPEE